MARRVSARIRALAGLGALALAACDASEAPVRGARGPFTDTLNRVEEVLRECLIRATGSVEFSWQADPGDTARIIAEVPADRLISCMDHVETARRAAAGNGNPQVIAAVLLSRLARELRQNGPVGRNVASGRV